MKDQILNTIAAIIRLVLKLGFNVLLFPLRVCKIQQNRIMLLNSLNGNYCCNPKYIAEYLLEHYPNQYEIIFPIGKNASPDLDELARKGITTVPVGTFAYYRLAMTAKVFITNSGGISYIPFRSKQIVINTWHGGGAYKKAGIDAESSFFYKRDCKLTSKRITHFISSSGKFTEVMAHAQMMDQSKFLEIGLPRNDIFFTDYQPVTDKIKALYQIEPDVKIALYAPTYRTPDAGTFFQHQIGPYEIDYQRVLDALTKRFGGKWVLAVRLHSSLASVVTEFPENVVNMSSYADGQEILCAADILINDYSSIMWDFVQMRKPCFIFATDYQKYLDTVGLYTYADSWPFPFAQDNDTLENLILQFDEAAYATAVETYFGWMENHDTGQSCKQLGERIASYCGVTTEHN